MTGQMVVPAKRITLRPVCASDAGLIALYGGDRRVARMTTSIPHPLPPGATEAFVARILGQAAEERVWAMDGSGDGRQELLGLISLQMLSEAQSEVGYWVAPQMWGSGLASEALEALVASNPMGNTSLVASVFQDNPASAKVVIRAGFQLIGESETHSVARRANVPTWDYVLQYGERKI